MHNFMKIRKLNEFLENLQKVHFQGTHAGADISWKMVEFLHFHEIRWNSPHFTKFHGIW